MGDEEFCARHMAGIKRIKLNLTPEEVLDLGRVSRWERESAETNITIRGRADVPEKLCRFDHHPNPAIDFCIEVEAIEGEAYDLSVNRHDETTLASRIDRAMDFQVGGDVGAVAAKYALRKLKAAITDGTLHHYFAELIAERRRVLP